MKERMITRTVNGYKVTCMTVNTETTEVGYATFTMGADYVPEKGLALIRKQYETDEQKIVAITGTETFEQLYGMPEKEFIGWADKLPPRGEKIAE